MAYAWDWECFSFDIHLPAILITSELLSYEVPEFYIRHK